MRLQTIGLTAITLIITFVMAPSGKTDEVSDARKAIQAAYKREADARSRLDVKGMYAAHRSQFVGKEWLAFEFDDAARNPSEFVSIHRTYRIQKFQRMGKIATVDCAVHEVSVQMLGHSKTPRTNYWFERDTWENGDQGWLMTSSQPLMPPLTRALLSHTHRMLTEESFPHAAQAIRNGEQLIQALTKSGSVAQQFWVEKPVAFQYVGDRLTIGGHDGMPIKLIIHFVPAPTHQSIILMADILGTI